MKKQTQIIGSLNEVKYFIKLNRNALKIKNYIIHLHPSK